MILKLLLHILSCHLYICIAIEVGGQVLYFPNEDTQMKNQNL